MLHVWHVLTAFVASFQTPWHCNHVTHMRHHRVSHYNNLQDTAEVIASTSDWGRVYDAAVLGRNQVPVASATYYEVCWSRVHARCSRDEFQHDAVAKHVLSSCCKCAVFATSFSDICWL